MPEYRPWLSAAPGSPQSAGPLDFRPWLAGAGKKVASATPDWLKDVVGTTASALGTPVSAIAEGLVGPAIRHGVNLVTGKETAGDILRDIPNAPQHLQEALQASIPRGQPGKLNLLDKARGQGFTGPQNIAEELKSAGYQGMMSPSDAEAINRALGGLPVGSAARFATSPEGMGILPEAVVGGGAVNKIAGPAFTAAGKAVANAEVPIPAILGGGAARTRAIPGIKQIIEWVKPGSSLPNAIRDHFYDILRTAEGNADWHAFLRRRLLDPVLKMSGADQNALRTAIETGTVPAAQKPLADSLINEWADQVSERVSRGLKPYERRPGVEYAGGRVATKATQKEAFGKKAFSSAPRGLGTGRMGQIAEQNLPLTTEQVAQKVSAASKNLLPEEVFEPLGKASLISGAAHDTRVIHADVVGKLMDKFGRPAAKGEAVVADLPGVPTGFNAQMQARMAKTALPPELHEVLRKLNHTMQPEEWGKFSQFVRSVNDQFRKHAMFSTGMISRNMQNNIAQTAIFGNMDPDTWAWALNLRTKMATGNLTQAELAELEPLFRSGIIGHGQIAMETGTKGTKALASRVYNAPFRAMRGANQFAEDVSRMAFGKYHMDRGLSPVAAGREVDNVLGNYSPRFQSKGFKTLRRTGMPFINWTTMIPQVFVRSVIRRPGSVGVVGAVRNAALSQSTPERQAALPDYLKAQSAIPISDTQAFIPQGYGSTDVSGMFDALSSTVAEARGLPGLAKEGKWDQIRRTLVSTPALREVIQRTYPQYGITYAALTGTDPLTGYTIRDWPKFLSRSAPYLRIPNLISDLKAGKKGAKERLMSYLVGVRTVQQ